MVLVPVGNAAKRLDEVAAASLLEPRQDVAGVERADDEGRLCAALWL
jgi:hypothetical protein